MKWKQDCKALLRYEWMNNDLLKDEEDDPRTRPSNIEQVFNF